MWPRDIQTRCAARPGSPYHRFSSKLALAGEAKCELAEKDVAHIQGALLRRSAADEDG